jgi:hypothetical protein
MSWFEKDANRESRRTTAELEDILDTIKGLNEDSLALLINMLNRREYDEIRQVFNKYLINSDDLYS